MWIFTSLWLVVAGAVADEGWVRKRVPALGPHLDLALNKSDQFGLATLTFGALALVIGLFGFLGLLGLPFSGLTFVFRVLGLMGGAALVTLGLIFGGMGLAENINNSEKEALYRRTVVALSKKVVPVGRFAWIVGLQLIVFGLLV